MIIYMATNNINNKKYIGQTVRTLNQRKTNHKSTAKLGKAKTYFINAINKHGWDNFTWQILWESIISFDDPELLDYMEKKFINEYKPKYNLRSGGQNGYRRKNCNEYKITTPNGNTIKINNLPDYCDRYGLDCPSMYRMSNGRQLTHKGYNIEHINEEKRNNALMKRNTPTNNINLKYSNGHILIKDNIIYEFDNIYKFCEKYDLDGAAIGLVLKGIRKRHHGFELYH